MNKEDLIVGEHILTSELDETSKAITYQLGDPASGDVQSNDVEAYGMPGYLARPTPASADGACETIVIPNGTHDAAVGGRDLRNNSLAGMLEHGETVVFAPGKEGKDQARLLLKQKGIASLFTRKDENAAGMGITLDPTSDTISILNSEGAGIIITGSKVMITNGSCVIQLASDLSVVSSGQVFLDGSVIALGATAAPGLGSVLTGTSGVAGKPSTKVIAAI